MTADFKIGDAVVCVVGDAENRLKRDHPYEIDRISQDGVWVRLKGNKHWWMATRFAACVKAL